MGPAADILHVDMDAFFVSVELLDRPDLRGRPVAVGGVGGRGVVAAASYEARSYGVRSAMASSQARRRCPGLVFLPARHGRYREVSARVMEVFRSFTPLVEPLSLDEAFLDVAGARRLHGPAPAIAAAIREQVLDGEGLTCSVGVAPTKLVAKLASEAAKPRAGRRGPRPGPGVVVVEAGRVGAFLDPLPVGALWGVGPATGERLARLGIATVGQLAAAPAPLLASALGEGQARHLQALARGVDPRPVEPRRHAKSIGHEETFEEDLHRPDQVDGELVRLADAVTARLRGAGRHARTVTLKVRFHDFRTLTRSVTLPRPVDDPLSVLQAARRLAAPIDPAPGVRLLGLSASALVEGAQLAFGDEGWGRATSVIDDIRARFGHDVIAPGRPPRRSGRPPAADVVAPRIPWDDQG